MSHSARFAPALLAAIVCAGACGAAAKPAKRHAGNAQPTVAAKASDCARANYPGDPVCAWEADGDNLPTPSARAVRKTISDDVLVNDDVSVGSADPKALAKPPVYINNPNPNPRKQDLSGGATVNYKF